MPNDPSTQRYMIAAAAILLLTAAGMGYVLTMKSPPPADHDAVDDVLNNAVITAVTESDKAADPQTASQTANQTAGQTNGQTAAQLIAQTAQQIAADPTPTGPPREDAVMANPGPDTVPTPTEQQPKAVDEEPTGSLDREVIRDGIQSMRPIVEKCYNETLKDFPDAEGRVTLAFTIAAEDDEGRVELSELDTEKTTLIDTMLHDCMLEAVGDLRFPAPEGNGKVNVKYPFNFAKTPDP